MITSARFVNIAVRDQQRALDFYTGVLGFELLMDQPMGPDEGAPRWIEVKPPKGDTYLVLFTPEGQEDQIGRFGPVWFQCDDLDDTYEDLRSKGVEFPVPPQVAPWDPSTRWAQFSDPDGNSFGVSAPR